MNYIYRVQFIFKGNKGLIPGCIAEVPFATETHYDDVIAQLIDSLAVSHPSSSLVKVTGFEVKTYSGTIFRKGDAIYFNLENI